jgi:hypothetical protein
MQTEDAPEGRPLVKNRTMEIVVALFLLALAGIVIYDTLRLGIGWKEGEGPGAGYFPFYIACAMAIGSLVTLVQAIMGATPDGDDSFVDTVPFTRVMAVLVPSAIYVFLIGYVGIYIASVFFITLFMMFVGREPAVRSVMVGVLVPVMLYVMFEKWFLVSLPKSATEIWAFGPPALKDGIELYLDRTLSPIFKPVYDSLKTVGETLFPAKK